MPTDTSEKSLESLIVEHLVDHGGYELGHPAGFDPNYALDLPNLLRFLEITQPTTFAQLALGDAGPKRSQFFARLQGEITKEGVIHVLRKGVHHGPAHVDLFYGTPSQSTAKPPCSSAKTFSASPANCTTAKTKHDYRSISASS